MNRNNYDSGQPSNLYSTNSWLDDGEASDTVVHDYEQVKQRLLLEQDKGLDTLGEIISRQKSMAQGICTEIDLHNEILDDIDDAMDSNNERLIRNTRNITVINKKDNTCCYWMVIFLLFIAIVVISII